MRGLRLLLIFMIFSFTVPKVAFAAAPLQVVVEGIEDDVLENVEAALAIPPDLVRDGKVDLLWLHLFEHEAADKVQSALQAFGYYNAKVTTNLETLAAENYRLRVRVEAGDPVEVTAVQVDVRGVGAKEESLRELVEDFPLEKGDVLEQKYYEEGKAALKGRAVELGYLDADFAVHEILVSRDKSTARIHLVLDTGARYFFGETRLMGAPDYPERYLRRFLAYRKNDAFSDAKVGETQLNFIGSDRFSEVIVTPEREKVQDAHVPLLVQLKPSARRRLRVGVGYGTDTGARFIGRYRDLNMFHLGHELQLELYVAERLQGFGVGYQIPGSKDINSSTGLQLNLQREDVSTYTSSLVSLEVNRNKSFGEGMLGTAFLQLLQEDFTVGGEESSSRLILPGLRFVVRRYDDTVRPTRGYRCALDLRGTHQFLGSDTGLIQFTVDGNALFPLPGRFSLFVRGKAGLTAQNDPLAELPATLRFFAGGDTSVRGYSYQSLGPRDASGQVVGGKDILVGGIELRRALFTDWGVSAFFDTGNAFNSFGNIHLFSGTGLGVHYYTRVGAINLYLARQVLVDNPGYHIHFSVGFEL